MPRETDRRDFSADKSETRQADLENIAPEVSERLQGEHRVSIDSFDAATGNPSAVISEDAPAEEGNYVQRALDHVQAISPVLGLVASQPTEFAPDPNVQTTSSGAKAVHLQQQKEGIEIFQAAQTVRFSPDGRIAKTLGSSVTIAQQPTVSPRLSVEEAVLKAAQHVAVPDPDEEREANDQFGEPLYPTSVDVSGFVPKVMAAFLGKVDRPTVLDSGPFGDRIKAKLTWFYLSEDDLRLAWEVVLTMPNFEGQYRTMVDAETGEILYCRQLGQYVRARGNVYRVDGNSDRELTEFPMALEDYGVPMPPSPPAPDGFPDDWIVADKAVGNNVRAHLEVVGPTISGEVQNGVLTFDPADPKGDEQKVLNIFYYNCYMHDYFYLLGFRETDGNFQQDNLGRGGFHGDRVDARSFPQPVRGTAWMATPSDGSAPVMVMGLVASTGRHTAFAADVVFHEFTHGVTNRLVGGPLDEASLEAPQPRGMGEGWSDYIACTINNTTVVGAWVTNRPGGIRGFPYNSQFPDHFGKLGTGRYTGEEHNIGEIWCATLMEMNRNIGADLGVQLVVDALKLSPTNPSFLEMRDSILAALGAMLTAGKLSSAEHSEARSGIWTAFAKFGMGPGARSNGASLSGIVADFDTP